MKAKIFLGNIVIAILSALMAIIIYTNFFQEELSNNPKQEIEEEGVIDLLEDSNKVSYKKTPISFNGEIFDFTEAADKSIHAVVHVTSKNNLENNSYSGNPIFDLLFGDNYNKQPSISFGSGVIISKDGYIVTNNHVVDESDEIQIVLNDKRTFTAKLVGKDPSSDLALLKVKATDLPYISLGNSDNLKVGEWVLAVGNPFNLTSTVTAGIVSAKARDINILSKNKYPIESFIQTDAAVNQGNSGGALVNMRGELVGINSAILSPSGAYSGYSFAIPVNIVKKIVADIIKYGEVQRAVLGITIKNITGELAKKFKLDKVEGVYIESVISNGAAKEAGIKKGDVILKINKVEVNTTAELTEQMTKYRPGELIYVTIKRNGKRKQFEVVLRNMQGNTEIIKSDKYLSILGAKFQEMSHRDKRMWGVDKGIVISEINDGVLKKKGIKKGYIILSVGGKPINNISDLKKELKQVGIGGIAEMEVTYPRSRYIYVYNIKLE